MDRKTLTNQKPLRKALYYTLNHKKIAKEAIFFNTVDVPPLTHYLSNLI
ncbi:hypothetical protein [Clostridium sp. DL-VIII]|nr:hypothetical protein [Clostridium sp. DL-VIII]